MQLHQLLELFQAAIQAAQCRAGMHGRLIAICSGTQNLKGVAGFDVIGF